jgi:hypothetical protein
MSVSYIASLKSTRMQAVINAIDASSLAPGFIEICTAGYSAVLCTITFQKPSFAESGGVITMQGAPKSGTATNTGTAVIARIKDGGAVNVVVSNLTIGTSSADIILNSTSIIAGQTVTLNSATITHSP